MRDYVWRRGDSLEGVSLRMGLSGAAVRAANPELDLKRVKEGQIIRLPAPGVLCPSRGVYVVSSGQSAHSISKILGVRVVSLVNANPYVDFSALEDGEVLISPEREYCRARLYDTLDTIAARFCTSSENLRKLNPSHKNALAPGAVVRLV